MTPEQFKRLRLSVGLGSQQAAADFLHRSIRTIHGWENGDTIDELAIKLLKLMARHKLNADDVG